jgi:hypothetical protein
MISRTTAASRSEMSPNTVAESVSPSPIVVIAATVGGGGVDVIPHVGDSPARTEMERKQVKATVNMNRFMELAP